MKAAVTIDPAKLALSVPVAATTDPTLEVDPRTWIAKLRTDRAVIFRASASKTSSGAAAEKASAVTVLAAAGVIALAVEGSAAVVASADSAAAGGLGADDNN